MISLTYNSSCDDLLTTSNNLLIKKYFHCLSIQIFIMWIIWIWMYRVCLSSKMNAHILSGSSLSNPFSTNVPLTDNPGSWFLLAKCLEEWHFKWKSDILSGRLFLWKSDILSKDAGHWPASLLKILLCHRCFSNI